MDTITNSTMSTSTNTDDLVRSILENNARRRAEPRKNPTAENPTPNWRSHGELPDDRRHPAMCHSGQRYEEAKLTAVLHTCRCGQNHDVPVYEDGTIFCDRMDAFLVANFETPDLKAMRREYEDKLIALIRSLSLN